MLHVLPENNEFEGEIIPCSDFRESTEDYCIGTTDGDCSLASSRPRSTGIACGDTETDKDTAETGGSTTGTAETRWRSNTARGVADALAARDADRSTNGDDSHNSGTSVRRQAPPARECTYPDFMKCKPLYFKGTKGVFELTQCALTWWNSHVKTVGHDVAYAMTLTNLKKKMTDKYNQRFQELALMCARIFLEESEKIEKYVGGLPDMIHGSVMASKPKTMQDVIEFTTELMDKKIHTFAERQRSGEKKPYGDPNLYAQNATITMTVRVLQNATSQIPTCYECGAQGHFKRDCSKLKNNNRGNQGGNGNALAKVYAVGRAGTNPDSNVVTGTFHLNNRYASVLFDTGADRSFISTAFRSQIDITLSTLDHYYDVELADGRII
ncbi:putative reverse transcriptase domain-containing protein, partial [Tanacetum coccineum]